MTPEEKKRRCEAQKRYAARKRGENVPLQKKGPKPGTISGSKHPNWKGEEVSDKGGRTRAQRKFVKSKPCEACGSSVSERHHKDGNTANNKRSNIAFLCRRCHMLADGRLDEFIQHAKENRKKRWAKRKDTDYRPGDPCPKCGNSMSVVGSFVGDSFRYRYVGCRAERGGCGYRAGSFRTPLLGDPEAT